MRLVEKHPVPDTFVQNLKRVDVIEGGFARFVLCVTRTGEDGSVEHHVAAKLVMPLSAVPDAILQATKAIAIRAVGTQEMAYN